MAKGFELSLPPFIDRTLLRARDPPKPVFEHIEYKPTLTIKSQVVSSSNEPVASLFKLSREQINVLRLKSKEDDNTINFTSFELFMGHLWKCVCKARGLENDEETKLYIANDYKVHIQPSLPPGYFGNVIMFTTPVLSAHNIKSSPSHYVVNKVHEELLKANNDYLVSALDYLELHHDLYALVTGIAESLKYSNLLVTSWTSLSGHDADFGWGQPIFIGPSQIGLEGTAVVLPNLINDKSMSVVISLQADHMKLFSKFFYETFSINSALPSKL